jgi:hypothetical protein
MLHTHTQSSVSKPSEKKPKLCEEQDRGNESGNSGWDTLPEDGAAGSRSVVHGRTDFA